MHVAVLGHSFVRGFLDHLNHRTGTQLSPAGVAHELCVSNVADTVQLLGESGARLLNDAYSLPHAALSALTPDVAILNFGSNDLASRCDALTRLHIAECVAGVEFIDGIGGKCRRAPSVCRAAPNCVTPSTASTCRGALFSAGASRQAPA